MITQRDCIFWLFGALSWCLFYLAFWSVADWRTRRNVEAQKHINGDREDI